MLQDDGTVCKSVHRTGPSTCAPEHRMKNLRNYELEKKMLVKKESGSEEHVKRQKISSDTHCQELGTT
jgi:hypothetical protein